MGFLEKKNWGGDKLPDPNLDKQEDLLKLKKSFNNTKLNAKFVPEREDIATEAPRHRDE